MRSRIEISLESELLYYSVRHVPLFCDVCDVLALYLPPIEENRRLKKPRSCILRDRSLLQLTVVSDVIRNWPITFLARSNGHRVTPT